MVTSDCPFNLALNFIGTSMSFFSTFIVKKNGQYGAFAFWAMNENKDRSYEALKSYIISIDELVADPTGIQEIVFMKNDGNEKVYNLNGQRLTTPQKGVNIMNGRKVIVK